MSRLSLTLVVTLIARALHAQTIQGIPKQAEVVATKPLPDDLRSGRALVIWMMSAEDHPVSNFLQNSAKLESRLSTPAPCASSTPSQ
jgi:hypothetical protein